MRTLHQSGWKANRLKIGGLWLGACCVAAAAAAVPPQQIAPVTVQVEFVRTAGTQPVAASNGPSQREDKSNVAVWLTPVSGAASASAPATAQGDRPVPRLVQRNKTFSPHVLVVQAGSMVQFPNEDPFFHNVFSLFAGKRFDLGLYEARNLKVGSPLEKTISGGQRKRLNIALELIREP